MNLDDFSQWKTPDDVERPVIVVGSDWENTEEFHMDRHTHRRAGLLFQLRGQLTCEVDDALWLVPPQSALWIPSLAEHMLRGRGPLESVVMFLEPELISTLPDACCALTVSPLLRELLLKAAAQPLLYEQTGPQARLIQVLLDELSEARVERLRLPMPHDARLRRLVEQLVHEPAKDVSANEWAKQLGLSERSLRRLIIAETGMSLRRYRQQVHIILGLQRLTRNATVQSVAHDLGYESASSFVTMFRKVVGTSPARYVAQQRMSVSSNPLG